MSKNPIMWLQPNFKRGGKYSLICLGRGFPGVSDAEESACNTGDLGLITGSGRFPGESPGEFYETEEPGGLQYMGSQRIGQY